MKKTHNKSMTGLGITLGISALFLYFLLITESVFATNTGCDPSITMISDGSTCYTNEIFDKTE